LSRHALQSAWRLEHYYRIEESLSVVLDEVLDELGVAEVDDAGVVLVE
jgi:hypothetical protein